MTLNHLGTQPMLKWNAWKPKFRVGNDLMPTFAQFVESRLCAVEEFEKKTPEGMYSHMCTAINGVGLDLFQLKQRSTLLRVSGVSELRR